MATDTTKQKIYRLRSWSLRGSTAVIDQGLYSASNFVFNILLARWLTPEEYGAFAVVFAIFLFLSGFHNALLLEPMSVLGPGRYSHQIETYLSAQARLHFILTFLFAMLMALGGVFLQAFRLGAPGLAEALLGSGLALPFILLLWLVRRMFYTLKRPANAMISSGLYTLFLGAGIWIMRARDMISSPAAFIWMGAASLLSSLLAGGRLLIGRRGNTPLSWREILRDHWDFGKWASAAAILSVASGQIQTFLLAGLLNLESAGAFRAMQNFMLPMAQTVTAIAILGLPVLSYDYGEGNLRSLRRKGLFITFALTGAALAYGILTWIFATPLEQFVYAGKYAAYTWLIPLLSLIPVFTAMATGLSLILRAIQRPQIYLIGGAVNAVIGLFSTILLVKNFGIAGATASLTLTYFAGALVTLYLYRVWIPAAE